MISTIKFPAMQLPTGRIVFFSIISRVGDGGWLNARLPYARCLPPAGPDAVRIEVLAQTLGVTRGGFYWYFADWQALLEEILDAWERATTDEVIERVEREGGHARAKLRRTFALTSSSEVLAIDLAVRDWARRDPAVADWCRHMENAAAALLKGYEKTEVRDIMD